MDRVATAGEWAHEVPPEEADPVLLEAHAVRELTDEHEHRSGVTDETSSALRSVFYELGAGVVRGRIGDGGIRPERPSTWPRRGMRTVRVARFLCMVAGILGFAVLLTGGDLSPSTGQRAAGREMDPDTQIVLATVCFWVACLHPIGTTVGWTHERRRRDAAGPWTQLLVLLPAIGTLMALNARGIPVRQAWFAPPVLPVWLALALSALVLLATALASRRPTEEERQRRIVLVRASNPVGLAEALSELPKPVTSGLLARRNAAVEVLAARGLIVDAEDAMSLPFGSLAWRTAPGGGS